MSNSGRPGWTLPPLDSSWVIADVVAEICARAGIPEDRIDVSALSGYVDGLDHDPSEEAFKAIEYLGQLFQFDPCSHDGKIYFTLRGGEIVAELTQDNLVDTGDREQAERKDTLSIPRVLHLEYHDLDGGLDAHKQTSDRSIDTRAVSEVKVETPVVMRADDAARAAVVNHKIAIEDQGGDVEITLSDEYIWLTDGDPVTLDGVRYRIIETDMDHGIQKYTLRRDRKSAYFSSILGVQPPVPADPPSLIVGNTVLQFIDSHILTDQDDSLGYYVAVSRASDNWSGASIDLSIDGGASFIASATATTEAVMGTLTTGLPAFDRWCPDDVNSFDVTLLQDDDLEEAPWPAVLNRSNLALVGNEIINFSYAEPIGLRTWRLSGLLRGRKGSGAVAHLAGERFVMLDRQRLSFIPADLTLLGRGLTFRVTSFDSETSGTVTENFTGQSQTERAPADLEAWRTDAGIEVRWVGVGRLGGGGSCRQGLQFVGYGVQVNGGAINATLNQSASIADPGGAVTIRVGQYNNLTGFGPIAEVTI